MHPHSPFGALRLQRSWLAHARPIQRDADGYRPRPPGFADRSSALAIGVREHNQRDGGRGRGCTCDLSGISRLLRLLSYTPAMPPLGGARYKTISSGPGGDRTRIFEQRTRGLPVGRQARERWWSQRESNPHDRCAKPASCHWMMAPSVKGGGTPRCRTGTSWVSSRRADRYARVPWCRRGASRAGERDLAGCQRSPRSGRADVVCAARHGGSVGCQPWIRTTVIRVKVGGPAVGRAGIRVKWRRRDSNPHLCG